MLAQAQSAPVVLIAEDDPNDLLLLHLAYKRTGLGHLSLRFLPDGQLIIDYIVGRGQYSDREEFPLPSLLVLDLSMPRFDGLQLLDLRDTRRPVIQFPVVVFSGSASDAVHRNATSYDFVTAYFIKSERFDNMPPLLDQIRTEWHCRQKYVNPAPVLPQ